MNDSRSDPTGDAAPADVQAGLTGSASDRRFVLQNLGAGPANQVTLDVRPLAGRSSPLVEGEVASRLPLERLEPGDLVALSAVITTGTGLEFRTRVRWTNADGSAGETIQTLEV